MKVRVRIRASLAREAPAEFKLWNAGPNPTDYGVHVWSARSVEEVLARYNERGNPLLLDVEHNGAQHEDGEPAVTAGYARLEVRAGEPWLVFDWSDFGRAQIASGERRFLSPEYDVDKNTGEILALYRVSLVADPGTHRARMLASARTSNTEKKPMDPTLSAILAVVNTVEDPAQAVAAIKDLVANMSGGETPPAPEPAVAGAPEEEEQPAPIAAGAKPAATKSAPALTVPIAVTAAADAAVVLVQNASRDHLLLTQGDKLAPSVRTWASTQPLAVVKGLLDAAPAKDTVTKRTTATRGGGGDAPNEHGLTEREIQKCKAKGVDPAKYAKNKAASMSATKEEV